MIYELRTLTLKAGTVAEWESAFAEVYPVRERFSKLGGMWHTDVGPSNQLLLMWPYESLQQRADVQAAARKGGEGKWPPPRSELIVGEEVDILDPVKNVREWTGPEQWGDLYELRMYTYAPGDANKVAAAFGEALPARDALYPVAGIFVSQLGNLNRVYQLFPFKSWAHRDEIRTEFRRTGVWPPHSDVRPMTQLVRMMTPATVSPLR